MASGIEGLAEFVAGLKDEAEIRIPGHIARVRDRLTLGVHRRVVLATPVDTGFHRASWNASLGTPDERTPAPGAESYSAPETPAALEGGSTSGGPRRDERGRFISAAAARAFEPGYVTNAGPAIVPLNEGSSQQAPAHFIQRAIEEEIADLGG